MNRTLPALLLLGAFCLPAGAIASSAHGKASTGGGHAGKHDSMHWGYEGHEGPNNWHSLSSAFATCGDGKNQSPIDIDAVSDYPLDSLSISYGSVPMDVVNNGHTIQFNYKQPGFLRVGGHEYGLAQFHFHTPSEHKINGAHADMEVHFVHKAADGRLAVLGVMINQGETNTTLKNAWEKIPSAKGETNHDARELIAVEDILPASREYYFYNGSLTTPPCSEGVRWFVLKQPIEMSKSQIHKFKNIIKYNARPVQMPGSRIVRESI